MGEPKPNTEAGSGFFVFWAFDVVVFPIAAVVMAMKGL